MIYRLGKDLFAAANFKRGTQLTFNAIKVFPFGNHLCGSIYTLWYSRRNIMEKSIHTSFPKEMFSIYFEHN